MRNPRTRAVAELVLAGVIWGLGFVATIWALQDFSPVGFLIIRFLIAFALGEIIRIVILRRPIWNASDFKLSIFAGVLLASFLLPQTVGLLFTTATNSGFLTILYVVIVPILGFIAYGKKSPLRVYLLAGLAFFGAWLLMKAEFTNFNSGDLWTILCAFTASIHILYLGRYAHRIEDSFRFNNYQSLWCLIIVLPLAPFDPHFSMTSSNLLPWVGLLCTAIASSIIGFLIQVRAQKVLSETTAAQLFLLESPFALFFGFILLDEMITWMQALGAGLILLSSYLTLKSEK